MNNRDHLNWLYGIYMINLYYGDDSMPLPDGVNIGEFTLESNITSDYDIVSIEDIGFTPSGFAIFYIDPTLIQLSSNFITGACFNACSSRLDRYAARFTSDAGAPTSTSQTSSPLSTHLNIYNNKMRYRATVTYTLPAGRWVWIAVK